MQIVVNHDQFRLLPVFGIFLHSIQKILGLIPVMISAALNSFDMHLTFEIQANTNVDL